MYTERLTILNLCIAEMEHFIPTDLESCDVKNYTLLICKSTLHMLSYYIGFDKVVSRYYN